ncbi:hypothetical protein [Euzebya tangerina]|uniref:hypothetical protein n=1 Tax=Euzebya tangerina TaxID=591198 RepID=UPI0013C3534E|nr:hypothetical protein [Euzebya tangerina]
MLAVASFLGGPFSGSAHLRDAREQVEDVRSHVRNGYLTLDGRWTDVVSDVVVLQGRLGPDDGFAIQLEEYRRAAADAVQLATSAYVRIEADEEPELDSVPVAHAVRDGWSRVAGIIDQAGQAIAELSGVVHAAERAESGSAALLGQIEDRMEAAAQAIEDARAIGFGVDHLTDRLETDGRQLEVARRTLAGAQLWEATTTLRRVSESVDHVLGQARGLGARRADLLRRHAALMARADGASQTIQDINDGLHAIRDRFAPSVWDGLADSPAQATALIRQAHTGLDHARQALTMDVQSFARAEESLAGVEADLARLDQLNTSVHTLRQDLEAAIRAYPALHAEAVRSLEAARAFVAQHRPQVSPAHGAQLQRAAETLAQTEAMAASGRADPFVACARLREIDSVTDAVLFGARSDQQRTQAYHGHVARKIQDATWAINRATAASGLGLIGWSREAKVRLQSAGQMLAEAQRLLATDLARADELASKADMIGHQIVAESRGFNR